MHTSQTHKLRSLLNYSLEANGNFLDCSKGDSEKDVKKKATTPFVAAPPIAASTAAATAPLSATAPLATSTPAATAPQAATAPADDEWDTDSSHSMFSEFRYFSFKLRIYNISVRFHKAI